jgi:UDP-2-acetamido-3-amino-2,3-dideoxy-glucuronate N-acetyltransferase
MKFIKHDTAIVDEGAIIGDNTKIWHWTHICDGAVIGNNCSLGQNVYIGNSVTIGNNVKIQNNVSVYDAVSLEDDVFCGPGVVFTNVYNPRSEVIRKDEYKSTLIKKGATLGANATIICGITVDEYAFVGAGSLINKNVPAFALVVGNPARHIGWMSRFGERIELPLRGSGEYVCPRTSDIYRLTGGSMSHIS